MKQAANVIVFFIFSFILLVNQQGYADVAQGKPIWEVGSAKVCGDKLCSEIEESKIPAWIKNNAKWWSDGQIDDSSFLSGIQYLIDNKIIKLSAYTKTKESLPFVPNWIKDTADWWASGQVSDSDFVNGMTWLIENGIIIVSSQEKPRCIGDALCIVGKVRLVVDGDTIYLDDYKIRLSLTNTPERYEAGYSEATSFTKNLCPAGSEILVDQDDGQPYDKYGRVLGKVFCGGKLLNEELLLNNHAWILTQYCSESEFSNEAWAVAHGC